MNDYFTYIIILVNFSKGVNELFSIIALLQLVTVSGTMPEIA